MEWGGLDDNIGGVEFGPLALLFAGVDEGADEAAVLGDLGVEAALPIVDFEDVFQQVAADHLGTHSSGVQKGGAGIATLTPSTTATTFQTTRARITAAITKAWPGPGCEK